jgi:hypothetical protein
MFFCSGHSTDDFDDAEISALSVQVHGQGIITSSPRGSNGNNIACRDSDYDADEGLLTSTEQSLCETDDDAPLVGLIAGRPRTKAKTGSAANDKDKSTTGVSNGADAAERLSLSIPFANLQAELGLGLGLGIDLDKMRGDESSTSPSKASVPVSASASSRDERRRPQRRFAAGRRSSGDDSTHNNEDNDDGNTSYSLCEDVDVEGLLDDGSSTGPLGRGVPSPRTATTPPANGPGRRVSASSPLIPNTRVLASPRGPTSPLARRDARLGSPMSARASPRVRESPAAGAVAVDSPRAAGGARRASVTESPTPASKTMTAPGAMARMRPRIDRDHVKKRLMERGGTLVGGGGVGAETEGEEDEDEDGEDGDAFFGGKEGADDARKDDQQQQRVSVLSLSTSFVAESATATIETAHKLVVSPTGEGEDAGRPGGAGVPMIMRRGATNNRTHDGVLALDDPEPQEIDPPRPSLPVRAATESEIERMLDFGGALDGGDNGGLLALGVGLGLGGANKRKEVGDRDGDVGVGVEIGDVKSALDRLMDDVVAGTTKSSGGNGRGVARRGTEDSESSIESVASSTPATPISPRAQAPPHQPVPAPEARVPAVATLSPTGAGLGRTDSASSGVPPPVPPKEARKEREAMILEKRRQVRRMEEENLGLSHPPRLDVRIGERKKGGGDSGVGGTGLGVGGRPARRRSRSTGDVRDSALTALGGGELGNSIEKELKKLEVAPKGVSPFIVAHREPFCVV